MKKISLAVFAMMMVAMLAVFAGCSSSSDTNSGTADSGTAQDNSLQNVLDKGTLVLGWTTVSHQWASVMKTTIL